MDIKLRHPFDGTFPITQAFGRYDQSVIDQFHLTTPYSQLHWGLDFGLPEGTPVLAADNGVVKAIGEDSRSGKYIIIDHGNGYQTHYYHLSEQDTNAGYSVTRGEKIGLSGSTGMTTGPHLHFQLNFNGQRIDPSGFFGEYSDAPVASPETPTTPVGGDLGNSNQTQDSTPAVEPVNVTISHENQKVVGNTGNPENPGEFNTLSAIALKLGLPENADGFNQIISWNPELNTGDFNVIPSNVDVYIPENYNMPQPVEVTAPTSVSQNVVEGDTIWDYYSDKGYTNAYSWTDFKTKVAELNGGQLPHLVPGENINLPLH